MPFGKCLCIQFWKRFDTKWLPDNKGTRKRHGTSRNLGNEKVVSSISARARRIISISCLYHGLYLGHMVLPLNVETGPWFANACLARNGWKFNYWLGCKKCFMDCSLQQMVEIKWVSFLANFFFLSKFFNS